MKRMANTCWHPIHLRNLRQSRFKPCLGPGYFQKQLSDCMLETCMLLAGVRVHEHGDPEWGGSGGLKKIPDVNLWPDNTYLLC